MEFQMKFRVLFLKDFNDGHLVSFRIFRFILMIE